MVQKSYGKMMGTRKKLMSRRKPGVTEYLKEFSPGDRVHIDITPSSPFQHPRFQGLTGTVIEKRGRNYAVRVRHGSVLKTVFMRPEHLRAQKQEKIYQEKGD